MIGYLRVLTTVEGSGVKNVSPKPRVTSGSFDRTVAVRESLDLTSFAWVSDFCVRA